MVTAGWRVITQEIWSRDDIPKHIRKLMLDTVATSMRSLAPALTGTQLAGNRGIDCADTGEEKE